MKNALSDMRQRKYSSILKDRCKMTLGTLIHEVFENQNPDGRDDMKSPADYWGLDKDEESRFRKINKLRSKIAHYGKEIDASSVLGHLTNEERRGIITDYGYIIKQSKTFRTAFPEDLNQVRSLIQLTMVPGALHFGTH